MITSDIRRIQTVGGHLFGALRRAFGKIVTSFLGAFVVGAGAVEGIHFFANNQGVPTTLTNVAAAAFGVVLGYAAGLTTAVVEAIRGILEAGRDAVKDAEGEISKVTQGAEGLVGGAIKAVEGGVQNLEHRG